MAEPGAVPPEKMLYQYLLGEVRKDLAARKQEVVALKTLADLKKRQARLKERFIAALGGFPEKTPLKARLVGKLERDDFWVEKVIYESQPEHHVTANLYVPRSGKPPYPGVLAPCGHSANGKAAEAYQRACILLAKNGFVALCYDPIGQGERIQLLNNLGRPAIPGSTSEHTMVGVGALLIGRSTATYRIWDGIRSLDYLASRPEVDPQRLGCTGNSGGGTLTAYLMALDDRIAVAAPSCYITSLQRLFETIGPQDAEQNITGQVAFGMDHADYLTMRAPKPTLMLVATKDFFDIDGAWATFREAKLLYGMIGHGERVSIFEYNDKHGFSKPRRQAAARWLSRWLRKNDEPIVEPDFPVFTDAELQCTRSGQVLEDFKGNSVFQLNLKRAQKWQARLRELPRDVPKMKAQFEDVKEMIGRVLLPRPSEQRTWKHVGVGQVKRDDVLIHKYVFQPEPGIRLPVLRAESAKLNKEKPLILYISDRGIAAAAVPGGRMEKLAQAGFLTVGADLPGWGETAPKDKSGMARYFGAEWREAFLSLHLNRPLLGQRVRDLLGLLHELTSEWPAGAHVIGVDTAGPVVLHAAVLDKRIKEVTIEGSVTSWADVVATPVSKNQLASVVPEALAYYDLPYLAAVIAPRRLTIRGAVDPAGNPVSQKRLEETYAVARETYRRLGAEQNLRLEAIPAGASK
jgi:dienelactone hydrolase